MLDSTSLAAGVVAVVLAAVIAYFMLGRGSDSAGSVSLASVKTKVEGVVLVGPCGGGKTVMYQQLCHGAMPDTVTSMVPAFGEVALNPEASKTVQLVDFPGHERLRPSLLAHVRGARGVVLVVDASGSKQIKEAASLLFALLSSPQLSESTPLLIFGNKADADGAKNPDRMKLLLQKEVDGMRKTSGTMMTVGEDGEDEARRPLGVEGSTFKFDDHAPCPVQFAGGSAVQGRDGLASLLKFLSAVA